MMLYFSSLLPSTPAYAPAAKRLFDALDAQCVEHRLLNKTKSIWLRDFMPVRTKSGIYISFRYEPGYLKNDPELRTNFRQEIASLFSQENIIYSDINLDGGNVIFSPSRKTAVISDRIFSENRTRSSAKLVQELEQLLEARIIIIPSIVYDMTGHSDGMVRFIDENTVLGNNTPYRNGLEQKIAKVMKNNDIDTIDFPYYSSPKNSAVGCYMNFLETEKAIFLPIFGTNKDAAAITMAEHFFAKPIVPVYANEIAKEGGILNCISWETL